MNDRIRLLSHQLDAITGELDIVRDCFQHFLDQPNMSQSEIQKYSDIGHKCVQTCRRSMRQIAEDLAHCG